MNNKKRKTNSLFKLTLNVASSLSLITFLTSCYNQNANNEKPKPTEPVTPEQPNQPTEPEKPKPTEPVTPEQPNQPTKPEKPKPTEPVTPEQPNQPTEPVEPERPNTGDSNITEDDKRYLINKEILNYPVTDENRAVLEKYINNEIRYFNEYVLKYPQNYRDSYNTFNESVKTNFDSKAKELYAPTYLESFFKNFAVPDNNGKLNINPLNSPRLIDLSKAPTNDRGKSNFISNDDYKNILMQSFSINIRNENPELSKKPLGVDYQGGAQGTA
ncbi:UNVERIFIED_CONTAM: hypothetical protein O8I53_13275 [Campylobacter lari]